MEVEWLILADAAQVVGNKLYLMGGGWDMLTVHTAFPVQQRCALAAAVKVPWNETNQPHNLEIEIQGGDGNILGKMELQFEVGRPPGIRLGQEQRMQIAGEMVLQLSSAGEYVIIARIEGQESKRIHFNAVPAPTIQVLQQPPPGQQAS